MEAPPGIVQDVREKSFTSTTLMVTKPNIGNVLQYLRRLLGSEGRSASDDRELLQRFVEHEDKAALSILEERYAALVWRVCRNILPESHDAEDAFQGTFLVFVRKAASIDRPHLLAAWLHGVAYRIAVRARANAARRRYHERQAASMSTPPSAPALDSRELVSVLEEEIARLPEKYRVPFVLCYLQGKTNEQAAQDLGCPKGTVLSRLARGRERLRLRLTQRGITLSATLFASVLITNSAAAGVPPGLVGATIKAALLAGVGKSTAGVLATAAALAEEEIKAMFATKLKTTVLLLLAAIFVGGGGVVAHFAIDGNPENPVWPAEPPTDDTKDKRAPPPAARLDRFGDPLPPAALARLGTLRFRHGHAVSLIAFFPDGKRMVYGGADPVDYHLRIAEAGTGRSLRTFELGVREIPVSLAVSSDGKTLAASFRNVNLGLPNERGNVVLWDTATGAELRRLSIPEGEASDLAFHPDGKTLALIAFKAKTLHLWDCSTGKPLPHRIEAKGKVGALAFSPDGKLLVFSSIEDERKSVCFWETNPWRERWRLNLDSRHPVGVIDCLAFSPDSKLVAGIDFDGGVRFSDAVTGKPGDLLNSRPPGAILSLGFAAGGKVLAVAAVHPTSALTLWDVAGRECLHSLRAHGSETRALAVASSFPGQRPLVATGGTDATVQTWDPVTGVQQNIFPAHSGALHTIALLADGRALTVSRAENTFRLWNASTGPELSKGSLGEQRPASILAAPSGKLLALTGMEKLIRRELTPPPFLKLPATFEKDIHLLDFVTGKEAGTLKSDESTLALAVTPDGRTLAATAGPKHIAIWDTSTAKVLRTIELDQEVYGLFMPPPAALSPDGKLLGLRLATVRPGGDVANRSFSVWDVTTGKQRWRRETLFETDALAFSPDGKMFAEAALGTIGLWDSETGKQLQRFDCSVPDEVQYPGQRERLAFTQDNKGLIAGSCGPQVFLWDLTTGAERRRFAGHRGRVFSVRGYPETRVAPTSHFSA